jgi:hypothetical protein
MDPTNLTTDPASPSFTILTEVPICFPCTDELSNKAAIYTHIQRLTVDAMEDTQLTTVQLKTLMTTMTLLAYHEIGSSDCVTRYCPSITGYTSEDQPIYDPSTIVLVGLDDSAQWLPDGSFQLHIAHRFRTHEEYQFQPQQLAGGVRYIHSKPDFTVTCSFDQEGQLHSFDDQPAFEIRSEWETVRMWSKSGKFHKERGPAIKISNPQEVSYYIQEGLLHRPSSEGPAVLHGDQEAGELAASDVEYWHHGVYLR